jgi:hypothetical protein
MARSAALNPASMPFFPGGIRSDDEGGSGLGFQHHILREQDRSSMSSLSISPSEYRSVRSSPSPPGEVRDAPGHQPSPEHSEWSRQSPTFRQVDASRPYPIVEPRVAREGSMLGSLDTLPEGDDNQDTPGPTSGGTGTQTPGSSFFSMQQQRSRESLSTTSAVPGQSGTTFHTGAFTSSSPVSSLDSGGLDHQMSFDAQLKSSPVIHDILDRLVRCEYSTRDVQRELGDMQRKINLLLERSLGVASQPEFKDPFASSNPNGNGFTSPPLNVHRPSIGNIAPNQPAPSDDFTTISQRLNTLTSSVGQLLALQTQQHMLSANTDIRSNTIVGINEMAPNQMMPPPQMSSSAMPGHGLPQRPGLGPSTRPLNPPMRTWSAGTLDLPMRSSDPNVGRPDSAVRDKRRSVSGLLRRESSGVRRLMPTCFSHSNCVPRFLIFKLIPGWEVLLAILVQ